MREHALGRFELGRHQHRRPVHRVEPEDVFADEVIVGGPVAIEPLGIGAVPDRAAVVEQRVEPHVTRLRRVPGQRDPPRHRLPAHREVGETLPDEAEHFVPACRRLHGIRMRFVVIDESLLEVRQLEEVVLLGDALDRRAVDRAHAVDQLVLGVIRLARDAVEPLVGAELDGSGVVDHLEELLYRPFVPRLGGTDEVGVGEVEQRRERTELCARAVDHLLGRDPLRLGGTLDLRAVLVGAREEHDVVPPQTPPASQRVRRDRRVRMPDVGHVVRVVDRRGDVERAGHGGQLYFWGFMAWRKRVAVSYTRRRGTRRSRATRAAASRVDRPSPSAACT